MRLMVVRQTWGDKITRTAADWLLSSVVARAARPARLLYTSTVNSNEIFAFKSLDTGQFSLAPAAAISILALSAPLGTHDRRQATLTN
jgi:hypothetical protein